MLYLNLNRYAKTKFYYPNVSRGEKIMIKSTFLNLPEIKKQRVIDAIIDEFAADETTRVSINNIIERADISRGSFYQYFDDKMDLVEVLFRFYIKRFGQKVNEVINVSRGDIFYTYEECFTIVAEIGDNEKDRRVLTKLFSNIYSANTVVSDYIQKKCKGFEDIDELRSKLSRKNLKSDDDTFFVNVNSILNLILRRAVREYYIEKKDYETVKKSYLRKIDIVKSGACA